MKIDLLLTKNVLLKLAESVLIPLGLIAASVADAGIHKKVLIWSALWTITLVTSNEEIKYIIKAVQSLKDSGLLIKGVNKKTIGNEIKTKNKNKNKKTKTTKQENFWGAIKLFRYNFVRKHVAL